MALNWQWSDKMGKMTIKQRNGKFNVNIYDGNCLAIFIYEYKDNKGEDMYNLYSFFMDKKHCDNMMKNHGNLFGDEVVSIELNLWYSRASTLLGILTKAGYKVKAYYKDPNEKRKATKVK